MDLLPLLLLFGLLGLMMFFMSRRQRRAVQQQQELQSSLGVGDRVMTTSGLYGTIVDTSDDATIDIEIAPDVVTTWLRAAVREKVNPEAEVDEDLTEDVDEYEVVDDTEVEEPATDSKADLEPGKQKS
jgi:preprotein translocase subunit YajC